MSVPFQRFSTGGGLPSAQKNKKTGMSGKHPIVYSGNIRSHVHYTALSVRIRANIDRCLKNKKCEDERTQTLVKPKTGPNVQYGRN